MYIVDDVQCKTSPDFLQIPLCIQIFHITWFHMKSVIWAKVLIIFIERQLIIWLDIYCNSSLQQWKFQIN